ncbi:hypothetical protein ACFO4O_06880 [Glaciecola siphonariae]|uniref:SD-repeat containing protein B domain-containing protein n=1 Tax=Glaciecola siphonariae TaxID=521012 RepID=A0ABV9LUP8_9ALTE
MVSIYTKFLFIIAAFSACLSVAYAQAESDSINNNSRFGVGEELILSVKVDNLLLGEVIVVVGDSDVTLGLSELLQVLDFPITALQTYQYEGWYISEDNKFSLLSLDDGLIVSVSDREFLIPNGNYDFIFNDLYVGLQDVNAWFELGASIDYEELSLTLDPKQKLPIQLALARKNKSIINNNTNTSEVVRPFLNRGYELFSPQVFDIQAGLTATEDEVNGSYSVLGAREIAFHNVNFFAAGNNEVPLSIARLNISKRSQENNLLGFMKASSYEFGDVTPVRVGSLDNRRQTAGIAISNEKAGSSINNEVTDFAGEILPDWDVELYRNGVLIEQLVSVQSGRYEFNNIPLLFGENAFEIVSYGPQGQVKRETITRYLTRESLASQGFTYGISINKDDSVLIKDESFPSALPNTYSVSGNYAYNLAPGTKVNFGHVNQFGDDSDWLVNVGLSSVLFDRLILNTSYTRDGDDAQIVDAQLRTSYFNQAVSLRASRTTTPVENGLDDTNDNLVSLSVSGPIWRQGGFRLTHLSELESRTRDSSKELILKNNLGLSLSRLYVYNQLEYRQVDFDNDAPSREQVFGSFGLQGGFWGLFARAFINYSDLIETQLPILPVDDAGIGSPLIAPDDPQLETKEEWGIVSYGGEVSYSFSPSLRARVSALESLVDSSSRYRLDLDWRHDWWNVSANASYSELFGTTFGLFGRFSFGGTPEYGEFVGSNRGLSHTGSLLIRAFIDTNGNYTFDEGETLVEGLKFLSKHSASTGVTSKNGVAELLNLQAFKTTDIEIDASSISDPFIVPALMGISVTPRAAFVDMIDFPLLNSGEIDGVVYISDSNQQKSPAAYINLDLFDKDHQLVESTRTEFDGFYLFDGIKPGKYYIKPSMQDATSNGLIESAPKWLNLEHAGSFISNEDIILEQLEKAEFYVAKAGKFSSKSMLTAYWNLNKKAIRTGLPRGKKVGVKQNPDATFSFLLHSSTDSIPAQQACDVVRVINLPCSVEKVAEWLPSRASR